MTDIQVGLIGLGTVGRGVFDTIHTHQQQLKELLGRPVTIRSIVIEHLEKYEELQDEYQVSTDINTILEDGEIDVVFEAIVGKEPAYTYVKRSLQAGKHVITANKEMF